MAQEPSREKIEQAHHGWVAFTKAMTATTVTAVIVLGLMALFLL